MKKKKREMRRGEKNIRYEEEKERERERAEKRRLKGLYTFFLCNVFFKVIH